MKKKVHLIPTTHWDYEWYFTQSQSKVLFEFHVKELLDELENGKLENYVLDGQTGIIEEYLKNNPEDKERIIKLNKSGKLLIGPWYTQTDFMIISGESIIKNLNLGIRQSRDLGGEWKLGYVPDCFGQSIDMPKIYNGFGIYNTVFWRGLSDSKTDVRNAIWQSNDGSKVNVYNIKEGYYRGYQLYDDNEKSMTEFLETITGRSNKNDFIWSLGGDQRNIEFNLDRTIDKLNKTYDNYEFISSTYENVFSKYDGTEPVISGELLDAQDSKIHRSIYSGRYDHKHLNDVCESLITYRLEPLVAMANNLGIAPKVNLIEEAWKLLLMNAAHDSAGACNSDITNAHILERFQRAEEIITSYIDLLIRKISETNYENNSITLFNTLAYKRNESTEIVLYTKKSNFKVLSNDKEIDYSIYSQEHEYHGVVENDESTYSKDEFHYKTKIALNIELNELEIKNLEIIELDDKSELKFSKEKNIENDFVKVSIVGDKLNFLDKSNNKEYVDFMSFENMADDGDMYDFSYLKGDKAIILPFENINDVKSINKKHISTLSFKTKVSIPKETKDGKRSKEFIKQEFIIEIKLVNKNIETNIKTINKSKDQRLRLKLNTGIDYKKSISDTSMGFIERVLVQNEMKNWKELKWKEEPSAIYPTISTVIAKDNKNQLNILLNGIKEYEFGLSGDVYLTLYRSVGYLGKPDLIRRPGLISGNQFKWVYTPDSQLLDRSLEWNISFNFEKITNGEVKTLRDKYVGKIHHYHNQPMYRFTGPLKYFVSHPLNKKQDMSNKIFEDINVDKELNISIIKINKDGNYVLRILNNSNNKLKNPGVFKLNKNHEIFISNLNEELVSKIKENNKIEVSEMKPGEIRTYVFK